MTVLTFLKMYGVGIVTLFGLDLVWLGVVAKDFYRRQMGHLLRPDVQWLPAVAFYLVYVAALVLLVAGPAAERQSVGRAVGCGALFGFATAWLGFPYLELSMQDTREQIEAKLVRAGIGL